MKKLDDGQKTAIWGIIFILGFILLIILILNLNNLSSPKDTRNNLSSQNCCNGSQCSDTYYSSSDNHCHLTLCENNPLVDPSSCTYSANQK